MAEKYELIECRVTGHAPYGLIIESMSGGRGYIDSADIADKPLDPKDWPAIGQAITGVVLAYLRDGRLVVSARPSDVVLVRSASDIQAAMNGWARLRRADEEYTKETDALLASADVQSVILWALSRSQLSSEPGVALRMLANAPSWLLLEVIDEVVRLIVEDNHPDDALRAIAAASPRVSTPALQRAIRSLLAESELNIQEYLRLIDALRDLGDEQTLDEVAETMLISEDPGIRASGRALRTSRRGPA